MPEAQAAAAAPAEDGGWEGKIWSVGKNVLIFIAIQYGIKQFMGGGNKAVTPTPNAAAPAGSQGEAATEYSHTQIPQAVNPLWPSNVSVDVSMYVATGLTLSPFGQVEPGQFVFEEKNFPIQGKDDREITTSISVPPLIHDGGMLFGHVFVGQTGAELDPKSPNYDSSKAYQRIIYLVTTLPKKKVRKTRNLLESKNETEEAELDVAEPASFATYYHPNFTLSFIPNPGTIQFANLHPAVKSSYALDPADTRDATGRNGFYYPTLYHNTFWQMRKDMAEMNQTIPLNPLDMNIRLSTLSNWQFQLMASMDEGMKETARKVARGESTPGGGDGSEIEMVKEVLLDSNIYLLATTVVATILHMIFELLAFKSDVGHWRKKKDNVGVSVRSILSNVFMQSVIFLYLMDNNENTSWMILFGQGMGIAIEAWKVTKAVNVRVREPEPTSRFHGLLPYVVVFEDKHQLSETEEKTEEYDRIAFKYMGIVAVPLLLAYAVYSLLYESHKSWYSFIIATLVGSVYAYGFLMMVSHFLPLQLCAPALTDSPSTGAIALHKLPPQPSP